MSPYTQHLVISTGRSDWTSRIEDERDTAVWGKFISDLKTLLGRRGEFHDPFNNVLISASSFAPKDLADREGALHTASVRPPTTVDAMLFPAFQHFQSLRPLPLSGGGPEEKLRNFVRSSLLPEDQNLHSIYNDLSPTERRAKTRDERLGRDVSHTIVSSPTILICSHGQRDSRCGILGPLLHAEFTRYVGSCKDVLAPSHDPVGEPLHAESGGDHSPSTTSPSDLTDGRSPSVNIGMISHVGGHKWAGNVILYIPPTFSLRSTPQQTPSPLPHPLAGCGIWYGRVEPRHVEGIVEQTLLRGNVIHDLFRGGISHTGEILRL